MRLGQLSDQVVSWVAIAHTCTPNTGSEVVEETASLPRVAGGGGEQH